MQVIKVPQQPPSRLLCRKPCRLPGCPRLGLPAGPSKGSVTHTCTKRQKGGGGAEQDVRRTCAETTQEPTSACLHTHTCTAHACFVCLRCTPLHPPHACCLPLPTHCPPVCVLVPCRCFDLLVQFRQHTRTPQRLPRFLQSMPHHATPAQHSTTQHGGRQQCCVCPQDQAYTRN